MNEKPKRKRPYPVRPFLAEGDSHWESVMKFLVKPRVTLYSTPPIPKDFSDVVQKLNIQKLKKKCLEKMKDSKPLTVSFETTATLILDRNTDEGRIREIQGYLKYQGSLSVPQEGRLISRLKAEGILMLSSQYQNLRQQVFLEGNFQGQCPGGEIYLTAQVPNPVAPNCLGQLNIFGRIYATIDNSIGIKVVSYGVYSPYEIKTDAISTDCEYYSGINELKCAVRPTESCLNCPDYCPKKS